MIIFDNGKGNQAYELDDGTLLKSLAETLKILNQEMKKQRLSFCKKRGTKIGSLNQVLALFLEQEKQTKKESEEPGGFADITETDESFEVKMYNEDGTLDEEKTISKGKKSRKKEKVLDSGLIIVNEKEETDEEAE